MTPIEFKAWFEGFTEALTGTPSKKQWERIKTRVAEIDGKPVTERIYLDRYWIHYWPHYVPNYVYPQYPVYFAGPQGTAAPLPKNAEIWCGAGRAEALVDNISFDSCTAMNALGKAEAIEISMT